MSNSTYTTAVSLQQTPKLLVSLAAPFLAGFVGSLATSSSVTTWYNTLTQPSFSPPNWVFGPVWTVLYLLMGIALYRVWARPVSPRNAEGKQQALLLFAVHLLLNAGWSIAFFGFKSPALGLLVIVILLGLIALLVREFYRIDKAAAYLLLPYLAWVAFATLLNFSLWQLN